MYEPVYITLETSHMNMVLFAVTCQNIMIHLCKYIFMILAQVIIFVAINHFKRYHVVRNNIAIHI